MAILVVVDDPLQCRLLESMLRKLGCETVVRAALSLVAGPDGCAIDCGVLDLVMLNLDGMAVLGRLRQAAIKMPVSVNVPVIVQTADGGIDDVVSAMRAGAVDFVIKPAGAERLKVSVRNAVRTSALEGEIGRMNKRRASTLGLADIITRSPNMAGVIRIAEKAATSNIAVLIAGEVDKELIARAIHASGEWRTKPFVAVKCGAPQPAQDTPQLPDEAALYPADTPSDVSAVPDLALLDAAGEVRPLQEVEAELIRFAIGYYHGQMSEVARRLRISRSTLYRKLEALKLAP